MRSIRLPGLFAGWLARVRTWFAPPSPLRRIEFTVARAPDPTWPQADVAAVADALERALARSTAEPKVIDTPVTTSPVAPPRQRASHPLAMQLAVQARRNVPRGRTARSTRVDRTAIRASPRPIRGAGAPKRRAAAPAAWIQARRSTMR
jgi:hypothetical protein